MQKGKKQLFILILILICMLLISCGQQEETETDNMEPSETDMTVVSDLLDSLTGYYIRGKDFPDGRSISLDFFIYREEDRYYGYMNMVRYEHIEGHEYLEDYEVRLLMEISREQEAIQAVCVEDFSEPDHIDRFGAYQEGDLLFTLEMDADELQVSWKKFRIDGLEDMNFFPDEHCLSVTLISQRDIEAFLRARGMEGKLLFQYDEDASGLDEYLEVYYDEERETGAGIYCYAIHTEDDHTVLYYSGFDIADRVSKKWVDDRFDVIHDGQDLLEVYDFEEEYNENGQLIKLETRDVIEGWADSPYEDTIVRVEYFYREDGTLERRECYYNERVFSTTGHIEKYYYDERERLYYAYSYITHGGMQAYYIYEGDCLEPVYCIWLDFTGACAYADYFWEYDRE